MDTPDLDLDELFFGALESVVPAALEQIGPDAEARFQLFRRLLAMAQEVTSGAEAQGRAGDYRNPGEH
jgi:hypothetical protein